MCTKCSLQCQYRFHLVEGYTNLVIGELYTTNSALMSFTEGALCEDIDMNFVVGSKSKERPLWFKANLTEIHSQFLGLSAGKDQKTWTKRCRACIQNLADIFNGKPLYPQYKRFKFAANYRSLIRTSITPNESWCSHFKCARPCRLP